MQDLINTWKEGKASAGGATVLPDEIIVKAQSKKRNVYYAHLGTILILTITLVVIAYFFFVTVNFAEALSRVGMWFMMGALIIRIVIEGVSLVKSLSIQLTGNTNEAVKKVHSFYNFRKIIHGPVTLMIVALYVAGFYFLTPEFSVYIAFKWMIALHASFLIGAIIVILSARNGIRKEMQSLVFLTRLRDDIGINENISPSENHDT